MSSADVTGRSDPALRLGPDRYRRGLAPVTTGVSVPATSRLGSLRRDNVALVARALLQRGSPSRSELVKATGLSATSITKITAQMMRARILIEHDALLGGDTGRPRVPVALDTGHYRFMGIHIGLRRTTGGLLDLAGNLVAEHAVTHRGQSQRAILAEVEALHRELDQTAGGAERVLGVGVTTGGRVDPAAGVVVHHPLLKWSGVDLGTMMGTTEYPVFVDNSVRALALAESYLGVARDADTSVFLFIGNIVGVGLMVDGRLRQGRDAAAGTIDHLPLGIDSGVKCHCGRNDCLSVVASDVAVLTRARDQGLVRARGSFEMLVATSRDGDSAAARLLAERAERVGRAAGLLLDILDPDVLVLGGGLLQAPEHLDALRESAARGTRRAEAADRIVPTGLGDGALVRGSASLVMDAFFSDPVSLTSMVAP